MIDCSEMIRARLKTNTITNILLRKNLSQNWLAERLGITSGYMSQVLSGSRNPSPQLRQRIMDWQPELDFDELFEVAE